ncbi:MAG: DUF262 domain-containing HNH endonuclease family protein [Candidatus Nanoarchaeia archaeon]|jgi:uncharacterized protein with ParB-like and HNH nuclease domain
MKINADELTINQLFQNNEIIYTIPVYQRGYSWTKDNLKDLWEDLEALEEGENHFLGSIVVINEGTKIADYNISEIVDGQQRLVTLSILFLTLRNIAEIKESKDYAKEIEDKFLFSKKVGKDKEQKIKLSNKDNDSYYNLINSNFDNIESKNIKMAYTFFKEKIENMNIDEIKKLFNKLTEKVSIVIIETDSPKSAFRLFETLNDRGLALQSIDLIKNKTLNMISRDESEEGKERLKKIISMWDKIIENLDNPDIDKTRFFRQYLMSSKIKSVKNKITQNKLYDEFCKIVENIGNLKNLENYIQDIVNKSELYNKICNYSVDFYDKSINELINSYLQNLVAIKAVTSYTLLLRAFEELKNPATIIKLIELIEIFAIRRIITNWSTSELDTIYNKLSIESFNNEKPLDYIKTQFKKHVPTDNVFEDNFKQKQFQINDQLKYILDTIELKYYGKGGKNIENRYLVHIEHIMPQTISEAWNKILNEKQEVIENSTNLIGNLTLLEKKLNTKISNNLFEVKKKYYSSEETDFKITNNLIKYSEWSIKTIKERSKKLAEIAVKIWNFE